jgi:hypothetical protein
LAWNPGIVTSVAAIEVYPAATLVSNGFSSTGYKKAQQTDERIELTRHLASVLALPDHVATQMRANADALDAVVCLLAAKEFVEGRAMSPEDPELAKKEGWIWSAGVTEPSERAHRARPQLRSLGVYIPVDPQTESQVVKDTQGMTPKDVVGRAVL